MRFECEKLCYTSRESDCHELFVHCNIIMYIFLMKLHKIVYIQYIYNVHDIVHVHLHMYMHTYMYIVCTACVLTEMCVLFR